MTKKHQEKIDREIRVKIQQSLYDQLQQKCDDNYKTLSEVIRDLVLKYLKE
jgi:metal-responsive CopG/Arc/MetJ family transcriptional regulator